MAIIFSASGFCFAGKAQEWQDYWQSLLQSPGFDPRLPLQDFCRQQLN